MDGSPTLTDSNPTDERTMPDDPMQNEDSRDSAEGAGNADASREEAEIEAGNDIPNDDAQADPRRIVEAVLMAAESPMSAGKIASIVGTGTGRDIKKHIEALNQDYDATGNAFRIEEVAGGFQILTRPEYNAWLTKLLRVRQETKLSPAAMETLAIIAYKQPCTRAEVEAIRGVAAGEMINRLREMNVVKIAGRAEDLGRPLLYGTTRKFLEVFGLPSLEDLPQVEALRPPSAKGAKPDVAEVVDSGDESNDEAPSDDAATAASMSAAAESETGDGEMGAGSEESPALHIVNDDDETDEEKA